MKFDGKVVVITGGSRGLGLAMANAFAARGASVVVASRKEEACHQVVAELPTRDGQGHLGIGFHAGRWADSDRLFAAVMDRFGRADVLINNAGMSPLYDDLKDVTESYFDKVVAVNLKGPFRSSTLFGSHMRDAGSGAIINVSSIAAVQPEPTEVVYAAAKAALNNLTVSLARAFSPQVRVNAIMPGLFLTDIAKAWDLDSRQAFARSEIPAGRIGSPGDITGAALYLASEDAAYTTGAVIKVDGGMSYAPA